MRVILFFIDGVGLGAPTEENPFSQLPLPHLTNLLRGQKLTNELDFFQHDQVTFFPTDATMGVPGTPQSATGQATIWTGRNAPEAMGEHLSGFPGPTLREWLERDHIYKQALSLGKTATFANAYTPDYFEKRTTQRGWVSVSTATMLSANLPLRNLNDLQKGKAVYYDITHIHINERFPSTPVIQPEQAARNLLGLAKEHDLTVFEYFLTDLAGHRQDMGMLEWVLGNADRFLGEIVSGLPQDTALIFTSDHGNCEDLSQKSHTRNLVPTLVFAPHSKLRGVSIQSLTDIAPTIMQLLKTE